MSNWNLNFDAWIAVLSLVHVFRVYGCLGSRGTSKSGTLGGVCCKKHNVRMFGYHQSCSSFVSLSRYIKLINTCKICAGLNVACSKSRHSTFQKQCLFLLHSLLKQILRRANPRTSGVHVCSSNGHSWIVGDVSCLSPSFWLYLYGIMSFNPPAMCYVACTFHTEPTRYMYVKY